MSEDVSAFRVDVPEAALADLRERLRRTRWPEPETVTDWSQGTPLAYARELCRYWLQEYEWPAAQARLNRFPQYLTRISDLDVHFVHVRSPHPGATPLVMTHGWPGSVVEFRKGIEPLTDPAGGGGAARGARPPRPARRVRRDPVDPPAEHRLRPGRLTGRAVRLDRGEVPGLERLR